LVHLVKNTREKGESWGLTLYHCLHSLQHTDEEGVGITGCVCPHASHPRCDETAYVTTGAIYHQ
ncbi:MAG TPA: hypothetical protein VJ508_08850, partial [Saprospiraceae bacterium]|nr:hypothetical protein [Saprospiraceae bacterium]